MSLWYAVPWALGRDVVLDMVASRAGMGSWAEEDIGIPVSLKVTFE
jgi:hypothetical protein